MKMEDMILTCIKEQPGISAKKIVSCLDSGIINSLSTERANSPGLIFKQLRALKRKRNVHNRGDRWYFMKRNEIEKS
ncbi:hypothetical protein [Planomicrobium sp. CPCC 101110]|uniref:hypothetical protein n=1 Tax=Planomicrobium sp. CPCC 101110 TaxID=2599619 RepID=UPI0011B417E0|nr:hypothetical protein [Planomicrobium sp. CPCC 101110]TWT25788.1 hypothetical protein FQV30_08285 [Planomicrobium sp. CPCC 101110]